MDTGKAIIIGAATLALLGGVAAWVVQPRFSLNNVGAGASIRLDRFSGDMLGCERLQCRPIVTGKNVIRNPGDLPDGFVLDTKSSQ